MTEIRQPDAGRGDRDTDLDTLRLRLRSLGYLDAGVDRFVLGPARQARTPLELALLSSVRIGALGGLLLGPAAVIGLGARMPGLITGVRDAIVLGAYLCGLFAAATGVAAFAAGVVVAWLAGRADSRVIGRARGLSLAAGLVVSLLCLAYLTLWWQAASGGAGWSSSPARTALALAAAAAISLLLGHAVTVAALAVIVTSSPAGAPVPGVPGASWRASLLSGAAAFLGAAALLVFSAPSERAGSSDTILTVVPSGIRVRVLAIDGFDPIVFEDLRGAGRIPTLALLFSDAAATLRLPSTETDRRDPARAWTTIATGQPVERHGVHGLETRRVAGVQGRVPLDGRSSAARAVGAATDLLRLTRPSIASGMERQEKTFWEVASAAGLRTVVINWWATWPARTDAGVVLTDRALLRLERGGALDAEIAPPDVYRRLAGRWSALKARAAELATRAIEASDVADDSRAILRRSIEIDADQLVLAAEVSGTETDLTAVYLPGLDIAQHALLNPGATQQLSPSALAARLEAVSACYVALDRLLASAAPRGDDEVLFVVTTPGRVAGGSVGRMGAAGRAIRRAAAANGTTMDVAPTILHALGVPISRGLDGAPLLELFTDAFRGRYPVRYVDTYGRPANRPPSSEGQPLDQEMIDRLRSLGYVR